MPTQLIMNQSNGKKKDSGKRKVAYLLGQIEAIKLCVMVIPDAHGLVPTQTSLNTKLKGIGKEEIKNQFHHIFLTMHKLTAREFRA